MDDDEELTLTDSEAKLEVDVMAESLEKQLNDKYNEAFIKVLKRVSYEIAVVGLPIKEACQYVGMDHDKFVALMNTDPLVMQLIQTKELSYKRGLIKTVSEKAKTDDKVSLALLQSRFPDEFNPRKGSRAPGGESDDMLAIAFDFIRKSGDATPLVKETSGSGKIVVAKRTQGEHDATMGRIDKILKIESALK